MNDRQKKSLTVVPNPVTDKLNVKIGSDVNANADLRLINNLGQVIYTENDRLFKGENLVTIPYTNQLPAGIYTLHVLIDNEVLVTKVIKSNNGNPVQGEKQFSPFFM